MTEAEYIAEFRARWPRQSDTDTSIDIVLRLADDAVRDVPSSPKFWVIRGDLIQLGSGETPHTLEDALASYRTAARLDPGYAEAWEKIGHYYDAILDDEVTARPYFEKARQLRQSEVNSQASL
jgi:cytochrome c-type biogenesis protein CcmH/NrfG